jgi:hypothetical protein
MIGTVKEINNKKIGNYENLEVKIINDENQKESTQVIMTTLKDKWSLIKVGEKIELVLTKNGKFWNVTDVKSINPLVNAAVKLGAVPVEDKLTNPQSNLNSPKTNLSNSLTYEEMQRRGISVSYAKDLACNGIIPPEDILTWSKKFLDFIEKP